MASIYLRNGVFQIQYFRNGAKCRHSLGTRSVKEAERMKRELEDQLEKEEQLRSEGHGVATLGDMFDRYTQHARVYYRKNDRLTSQLHTVERVVNSFTTEQKEMLAQDFGPLAFQTIRNKWIAENLSRKTCNLYASVLKTMFKWAVPQEMVPVRM